MNFLKKFNSLSDKQLFVDREGEPWRELWIVYHFLKTMSVGVEDEDLKKIADIAPDIEYKGEKFEVKEIIDKGRRRQDEIRTMEQNTSYDNIKWGPIPLMNLEELMGDVVIKVEELHYKYSLDHKEKTNLIIYFNKHKHLRDLRGKYQIENAIFKPWKSVSVISDKFSCVLSANDSAPEYIKDNIFTIIPS